MKVSTWIFVVPVMLIAACGTSSPDMDAAANPTQALESWHDPVPAPPPPANMPAPDTPQFFAAAAQEYAYSQGRGEDQQASPDYNAKVAPLVADYLVKSQGAQLSIDHPVLHDPYITDWGSSNGTIADTVIVNRYGAKLNVRLYGPKLPFTDPVTGAISTGPFPTVIFIPGDGGDAADTANDHFSAYENSIEQIAMQGYIAVAVVPQGEGGSEYFQPPSPYCDPNGSWKRPQELGLTEQGDCAGRDPALPASTGQFATLYNGLNLIPIVGGLADSLLQPHLEPASYLDWAIALHEGIRPRFVFPALDAAAWALTDANPWRALVDGDRLGIVGHSGGADASVVAGNGDPQHRFKTAVAWDSAGLPPDTVYASVPTMFVYTELQPNFGPYTTPQHTEYFPSYRMTQRFIKDSQNVMTLALRGSDHEECIYIPYALIDPLTAGPIGNNSSKGGQVNLYYTVAWLDRWLKGANTSKPHGDEAQQIASARARLLARKFDDSVDRFSQGQGTYDFATQSNAPYKLAGENIADHLTFFLLSQLAFDGNTCLDWQAGCPIQQ